MGRLEMPNFAQKDMTFWKRGYGRSRKCRDSLVHDALKRVCPWPLFLKTIDNAGWVKAINHRRAVKPHGNQSRLRILKKRRLNSLQFLT